MVNIQWIILLDSIRFNKIKIIGIKTDYFDFKEKYTRFWEKTKEKFLYAEDIHSKAWTN